MEQRGETEMTFSCINGNEVQVLQSQCGWYIGTLTKDGLPNCRISQYYYKTRETAQQAFETDTFTPRYGSAEVECCSGWFRLQIKGENMKKILC